MINFKKIEKEKIAVLFDTKEEPVELTTSEIKEKFGIKGKLRIIQNEE